jgi:hypothetical protein
MTHTNKPLRKALDALNTLIADGAEYPDAHAAVVTTHGLTEAQAAELAHLYDSQDAGGAA